MNAKEAAALSETSSKWTNIIVDRIKLAAEERLRNLKIVKEYFCGDDFYGYEYDDITIQQLRNLGYTVEVVPEKKEIKRWFIFRYAVQDKTHLNISW